jgi:type 1 glutamine amidotransferase
MVFSRGIKNGEIPNPHPASIVARMKSQNESPRSTGSLLAAAFSLIVLSVVVALATSCGDSAEAQSGETEPTKIVFISGKPSHPSGQHEFRAGVILLSRALRDQSGLPVEVVESHHGWPEDESILEGAEAVIIYSDGNAKHPVNGHEEKIDALVKSGVGMMCMHYGVEVPKGPQGEYFKQWIGGHYESGFSTNPHWTAEVELNQDHPISTGVPGFTANDEWYYNIRFADPKSATDILTGVPTRKRINRYIHWTPAGERGLGKKQTMLWAVERADGGRGVGFTGGHWHRNWANDDFRRVVLNAIVWTAGMDVPETGVKSEPVTEAQLNENLDEKKDMVQVEPPTDTDLNQPPAERKGYGWPGMPKKK